MRQQDLSARRFTSSAIHIVEQLWPRAAARGISSEVNEHSLRMLRLWSLRRWERKVGLVALERLGADLAALAREVDQALSEACAEARQHPGTVEDFDAPLEPLLGAAEQESRGLGHDWV